MQWTTKREKLSRALTFVTHTQMGSEQLGEYGSDFLVLTLSAKQLLNFYLGA